VKRTIELTNLRDQNNSGMR